MPATIMDIKNETKAYFELLSILPPFPPESMLKTPRANLDTLPTLKRGRGFSTFTSSNLDPEMKLSQTILSMIVDPRCTSPYCNHVVSLPALLRLIIKRMRHTLLHHAKCFPSKHSA